MRRQWWSGTRWDYIKGESSGEESQRTLCWGGDSAELFFQKSLAFGQVDQLPTRKWSNISKVTLKEWEINVNGAYLAIFTELRAIQVTLKDTQKTKNKTKLKKANRYPALFIKMLLNIDIITLKDIVPSWHLNLWVKKTTIFHLLWTLFPSECSVLSPAY